MVPGRNEYLSQALNFLANPSHEVFAEIIKETVEDLDGHDSALVFERMRETLDEVMGSASKDVKDNTYEVVKKMVWALHYQRSSPPD